MGRPRVLRPQLRRDSLGGNAIMAESDGHQCCFCGQSIEVRAPDPVMLSFEVEGGGTQQLSCHASCLRRLVHSSVPLAV